MNAQQLARYTTARAQAFAYARNTLARVRQGLPPLSDIAPF